MSMLLNVDTITATGTLSDGNTVYLVDATSNNIIITLPNITSDGFYFTLTRIDSAANSVTIQGSTVSQTINGSTSITLDIDRTVKLESFGINNGTGGRWYIINNIHSVYTTTSDFLTINNTSDTINTNNMERVYPGVGFGPTGSRLIFGGGLTDHDVSTSYINTVIIGENISSSYTISQNNVIMGFSIDASEVNSIVIGYSIQNLGGYYSQLIGTNINQNGFHNDIIIGNGIDISSNHQMVCRTGSLANQTHINSISGSGMDILGGVTSTDPLRVGALEINKTLLTDRTAGTGIKVLATDDSNNRIGYTTVSNIDLSAVAENIVPATNNAYDIGQLLLRWNNIYTDTLYARTIESDNGFLTFGTDQTLFSGRGKYAFTGANASVLGGPSNSFYTASDQYPVMQILPYAHNSSAIFFDGYFDGSQRSSSISSNFKITKSGTQLLFQYDSGVAVGGIVSFSNALTINTAGTVDIISLLNLGTSGIAFTNTARTTDQLSYYKYTEHSTTLIIAGGAFTDTSSRIVKCTRIGQNVTITLRGPSIWFFNGTQSGSDATSYSTNAIPAEFRPSQNTYGLAIGGTNTSSKKAVAWSIVSTGEIYFYSDDTLGAWTVGSNNIRNFSFSYTI